MYQVETEAGQIEHADQVPQRPRRQESAPRLALLHKELESVIQDMAETLGMLGSDIGSLLGPHDRPQDPQKFAISPKRDEDDPVPWADTMLRLMSYHRMQVRELAGLASRFRADLM